MNRDKHRYTLCKDLVKNLGRDGIFTFSGSLNAVVMRSGRVANNTSISMSLLGGSHSSTNKRDLVTLSSSTLWAPASDSKMYGQVQLMKESCEPRRWWMRKPERTTKGCLGVWQPSCESVSRTGIDRRGVKSLTLTFTIWRHFRGLRAASGRLSTTNAIQHS